MAWRSWRLKHLAAVPITNGLGEKGEHDDPAWPRYIRTTDIAGPTDLREDTFKSLPPDIASRAMLESGDLLMTAAGATIGKSFTFRENYPACYAGYLVRFRPVAQLVDARFIAYWMQSAHYWAQVNALRVKSTIENFSASKYSELSISLPPIPLQRAIADYLDTETARIDALIAEKSRLRLALQERAVRVLNEAFNVEHELNTDGVPVGLPGFEMARLGYLARVQTGLTLDSGRRVASDRQPVAYLRVANVQDGRLDLAEVKTVTIPVELEQRCSLERGDVLMTEGGDPDKLGRGTVWQGEVSPCVHQNHVFAVRCDSSRLLPEFLALVTRTAYARRYFEVTCSKTTGIASTSSSKIADFRVPLPSLEKQRSLLQQHDTYVGNSDSTVVRLDKQIALLKEHRQALITAAVTGELEIPGVA